jgi:hypothetical protein
MGLPTIVCPDSEALLQSFTGRAVALRLNSCRRINAAVANVRKSGNRLFCIIVEADRPLAEIDVDVHDQAMPLAVMAPSAGRFRDLAGHLDRLRKLNLRVYLPCDHPDNLAGLRILSSVGIACCADFRTGGKDWEALADLATYAVLERAPHAAMEPFAFMAANYYAVDHLDWGRVCFDAPSHFLHLDGEGRVALSQAELAEGRFVAHGLDAIEAADKFPPIRERLRAWRHFFIDRHPCAVCAGWRMCRGKFSDDRPENAGCAEFFGEMIGLARRHMALQVAPEARRVWQP